MSTHTEDEAAIRQSHHANIDALNRVDFKAWAASFASDADYLDSFGHLSKGRENIAQRFQGLLTGPLQGAKAEGDIESIRFLTPTLALIDLTAEITPIQGLPRQLRSVAVLLKQDGQWLTAAGRSWVPTTEPV
jgi:uncharacterized protein (TIGR02246 family)